MLNIEIVNDGTGTERSANYKYVVRVNDEVLEIGTIKGHDRSDGWRYLVTLIGTPPAFRSAIPVGVTVESHLTMRAADCCPRCGANDWRDAIVPDTLEICNVCGNSR